MESLLQVPHYQEDVALEIVSVDLVQPGDDLTRVLDVLSSIQFDIFRITETMLLQPIWFCIRHLTSMLPVMGKNKLLWTKQIV